MNEKHLIDSLARMGTRTHQMPRHKVALRRALMGAHALRSSSIISEWRSHLGTFLTSKNVALPIGALAVFVLMFTTLSGPESASQSEARALLERSFARALALPPEAQARLVGGMDTDLATAYAEAKEASDLRIISTDEFIAQSATFAQSEIGGTLSASMPVAPSARMMKVSSEPVEEVNTMAFSASLADSAPTADTMMMTVSAPVDTTAVDEAPSLPVAYISYTDTEGRTVVIGIDADDMPILRIITSDRAEDIE